MRYSTIVLLIPTLALNACSDMSFENRDADYVKEARTTPSLIIPKEVRLKRGKVLYAVPNVRGKKNVNPSIVPPGSSLSAKGN